MKRKIVPMMIVGAMLTSAVPAQAATLPMFKQSETVTISREEYENYQRYQKLETLFQIVEAYYYEDVDEDAMLESAAVGLMAYGVLVVTQSDNVIRFILQKRMADTHPLVTILGVLIGLPLFGFMGVIFGPLLLAMFVFFVHIFKRKYLDGAETARLFVPDR